MCKEPFYNLYIYKGLHCKMTRIFPILTSSLPVILFLMSPVRGLISFSLNPRKHQGQRLSALLCAGSKPLRPPHPQPVPVGARPGEASTQAVCIDPSRSCRSIIHCIQLTQMSHGHMHGVAVRVWSGGL